MLAVGKPVVSEYFYLLAIQTPKGKTGEVGYGLSPRETSSNEKQIFQGSKSNFSKRIRFLRGLVAISTQYKRRRSVSLPLNHEE